ncbi:hypothetical protein [Microbacterium sp. 179-I 3D4 NHS]|uniref:hypothetical protein n=1 Tax=Microbacterium sp. 179-I 3D4 NHS TaxID=3142381 RepID=UPI0039A1C9F0
MNTSLTRSTGFWVLLALSLASTAVGGWLVAGQLTTMTAALTNNTATGVDVYVGQSLVVVGAALLGAGVLGVLLSATLSTVRSILPAASSPVSAPVDAPEPAEPADQDDVDATADAAETPDVPRTEDDQKGSSGSTATATKISVK